MIDETPLVNAVTLASDDDDDIPVAVCFRCGLVAGPDWDEVILSTDGKVVCHGCATDGDKTSFFS